MPLRTIARITALSPGQSPPPVRIPMRIGPTLTRLVAHPFIRDVDNPAIESRRDHAILYDSDCGFCKLCVRALLRLDRDERLRPVAIQSEEGQRLLTEVPEGERLDSVHLITPGGTVISGGEAAEPVARLLPAGNVAARAFHRFPDATDKAYRWVARNRQHDRQARAPHRQGAAAGVSARARLLIALVCGALALSACGSEAAGDPELAIYLSAPLSGPRTADGRDIADGAQLALADAGGEAAGAAVALDVLDDADEDGWQAALSGANARRATEDASAIAYIGELDSGATRTSLPITNEAGLLQVSAGSGADDLTRDVLGSERIPDLVQPSGSRTFGRVIPSDRAQGEAAGAWMADLGVASVELIEDESPFSASLGDGLQSVSDAPAITSADPDAIYVDQGRPEPARETSPEADARSSVPTRFSTRRTWPPSTGPR